MKGYEPKKEANSMICTSSYSSPLGSITLAGSEKGLSGLWFNGQKYFAATLPEDHRPGNLPVFDDTRRWLDIYFQGKDPGSIPPLSFQATLFRQSIWEILLGIPYGKTTTYSAIAEQIARQKGIPHMSAQAVGNAVAHNPISIIIPCHRVVGANGSLTGYAGGIEKKIQLLTLEKADMSRLFVPKNKA